MEKSCRIVQCLDWKEPVGSLMNANSLLLTQLFESRRCGFSGKCFRDSISLKSKGDAAVAEVTGGVCDCLFSMAEIS